MSGLPAIPEPKVKGFHAEHIPMNLIKQKTAAALWGSSCLQFC